MQNTYSPLFIAFLFAIFFPPFANAQRIENVQAKVEGESIKIYYDLISTAEEQTFDVLLFSSVNKYTQPLERIAGEVGKNVKPGINKVITWNAESELVKYRGEVTFELQVKVFVPFVVFKTPTANSFIRRGKANVIEWNGGSQNSKLTLELYHDDAKVSTIETTDNHGRFRWSVPSDIQTGKNYKIKITDSRDSDNIAFSANFGIKGKMPMLVKIGIPVAVGGIVGGLFGAGIIGGSSGGGGGGSSGSDNKIPDPPNPDGG